MITCPVCNQNILPINKSFITSAGGITYPSKEGTTYNSNVEVFSCNEHFNIVVSNKILKSIHINFQDFSIMGGYLITPSGKWIDDTSWCSNIITIDNFNDFIQKAKKFMKYKAFL